LSPVRDAGHSRPQLPHSNTPWQVASRINNGPSLTSADEKFNNPAMMKGQSNAGRAANNKRADINNPPLATKALAGKSLQPGKLTQVQDGQVTPGNNCKSCLRSGTLPRQCAIVNTSEAWYILSWLIRLPPSWLIRLPPSTANKVATLK